MAAPNRYGTEQPLQSRGIVARTPISAGEAQVFDTSGLTQRADQLAANEKRSEAAAQYQNEEAKSKAFLDHAKFTSKMKGFLPKFSAQADMLRKEADSLISSNPLGITSPKSDKDKLDVQSYYNAEAKLEDLMQRQNIHKDQLKIVQTKLEDLRTKKKTLSPKSSADLEDFYNNPDRDTIPELIPNVTSKEIADNIKNSKDFYNVVKQVKDPSSPYRFNLMAERNTTEIEGLLDAGMSDPNSEIGQGLANFVQRNPEWAKEYSVNPTDVSLKIRKAYRDDVLSNIAPEKNVGREDNEVAISALNEGKAMRLAKYNNGLANKDDVLIEKVEDRKTPTQVQKDASTVNEAKSSSPSDPFNRNYTDVHQVSMRSGNKKTYYVVPMELNDGLSNEGQRKTDTSTKNYEIISFGRKTTINGKISDNEKELSKYDIKKDKVGSKAVAVIRAVDKDNIEAGKTYTVDFETLPIETKKKLTKDSGFDYSEHQYDNKGVVKQQKTSLGFTKKTIK